MMSLLRTAFACAVVLVAAPAALAAPPNWAAPEIRAVTAKGVLGTSPAAFQPDAPLTQGALAQAIAAVDKLSSPTPAGPVTIVSTIPVQATIAGAVHWQADAPNQQLQYVDFLVDNRPVGRQQWDPYELDLDTRTLPDGLHTLAVSVTLEDGSVYAAAWSVTVLNAGGTYVAPLSGYPSTVPITSKPAATQSRTLYKTSSPGAAVTLKQLDAALVNFLGLADAAATIQGRLSAAGLQPPPGTGSEVVARLLGLRTNHPANLDAIELLPWDPVTRAEAAYSFAHVVSLDTWARDWATNAAQSFTLPGLSDWQKRILRTAVSYVGYPYIWGGTSPTRETFGSITARGGFDCSGFVWRVYKLTSYAGEGSLASVLRGRTTYQMSGEVGPAKRIAAAKLQPADVMFFGNGPKSSPSVVGHTGIYMGNGWLIHSSGNGVTMTPFDGWYAHGFAWGRRPLHEAGLA